MRYVKDALWNASATKEEKARIAKIDGELEKLRKRTLELSRERYTITNRLTNRTKSRQQAGRDPASPEDFRTAEQRRLIAR